MTLFPAHAQQSAPPIGFFADDVRTHPVPANFSATPFLDNNTSSASNAGNVTSTSLSLGKTAALQVRETLSNPNALALFGQYAIQYVFTEFTGASRVTDTRSVADAVLNYAPSRNAFVGNFNFYPNSGVDTTRPSGQPTNENAYLAARGSVGSLNGNLIAAPALLPGSIDFRNPAASNSTAPNIRSALFTLPIQRLTFAMAALTGSKSIPGPARAYRVAPLRSTFGHRLIPWVSRFNNWGNTALGGGAGGSGFVQNAATPADGQLLSRGDFAALVLHYRMRGATSVMLASDVNTGVAGYSDEQARSDIAAGWGGSSLANEIIGRDDYLLACLNNVVGDSGINSGDVSPRSTEAAGVVWSGVYDRAGTSDPVTGRRRLVILLSNLGPAAKVVDLPNDIDRYSTFKANDRGDDFYITAGSHRLLQFSLRERSPGVLQWIFDSEGDVSAFASNDRNGTGIGYEIPQPVGPSANITAPASVCTPSSGNVASVPDAGAGASYAWTVTGGTLQSGQGTRQITFGVSSGSSVTLSVTVSDGNGVSRTASFNISSVTNLSCSISGTLSACANRQFQYASSAPAGATHNWSITGNGTISGPNDAAVVTVNIGAPGSFELSDMVSLGNCQSTCSRVVQVRDIAPVPVIEFVPAEVDPGITGNIARAPVGYDGYFWEITNGTADSGNFTREITYTTGSEGAVLLKLTAFKNNACSSTVEVPVPFAEQPFGGSDRIARLRGSGLRIPVAQLFANDYDPLGQGLTITEVDSPQLAGASAILDGEAIVYTPPPNSTANDRFRYAAVDGRGRGIAAFVDIVLAPQLSLTPMLQFDFITLHLTGAPSTAYNIEFADRLLGAEWSLIGTIITDSDGGGALDHTPNDDPPPNLTRGFYRAADF